MPLKVKSTLKRPGVIVVSPIGSINASTYGILEAKVDEISKTRRMLSFSTWNLPTTSAAQVSGCC